jgi:integrase
MANQINLLDNATVKNLTKPGRYADGGNLCLVVSSSGAKKWVFYYRDPLTKDRLGNGKRTELGLGGYPFVTLQQARIKANKARALLNEQPPRSPKLVWSEDRRVASIPSFAEEAETFLATMGSKWNARHRAQVRANLLTHCKPFADKRVDTVTTENILNAIMAYYKQAPASALRMRHSIEQVLAYAKSIGHITEATPNPARWGEHMQNLLPRTPDSQNHKSMSYADAPDFVARLRGMRFVDGKINITAFAMELIIRAGTRLSEVRLAKWSEFNLAKKEWFIPAERMQKGSAKVKVAHFIPLASSMLEILNEMQAVRSSDYVFPGSLHNKPLDRKNFERLLEDAGLKGVATVHGFRQSFSNWGNNIGKFRYEIVERALSHKVGTKVGQSYWTEYPFAEHRALTEAWNNHLDAKPANVVQLRA